MPRRLRLVMPLARKISLLFGTAVLLTITATLAFPWRQMTALNEQAMLLRARQAAMAAYQAVDLRRPDWLGLQDELARVWPDLSHDLGVSGLCPELVAADAVVGTGFREQALERLRTEPEQRYYWEIQDEGRRFRFALAVRGTQTDPHPDVPRGIIDVRLPMSKPAAVYNFLVTVLAGASGAVLAILVFYIVTQRLVLSPVHDLQSVAEQVTRGDIGVRASINSGDEFEELAGALNEMLTHLKTAQDDQRKINRSLDVRLGELAETNVALYEANRLKSEFLANVSHELRTPLVSIIGFAELLRDAWDSPKTDRTRLARYSENILTSGRSLLDIINDLLDLAKIEAGKLELHVTDVSMATLCGDLIDFVRPLADKRNQRLQLESPDDMPPLHSDAGRIKQVLYNLLSNAIKFTPTGGEVRLVVEPGEEGSVRLSVSDTGPGIPEDQLVTIFEQFRQLDSSETREHQGTGLGLTITKDLVEILGGSIRVENRAEGGARFTVVLPQRAPAQARSPQARLM